jgi:UDP-N-acetylmuramate--alanine ligase
MKQFKIKIAVAGCHGKTTTSSLLVYALTKLKASPSYLVGTPFLNGYEGADFQGKKYFVIEADEYGVNPPWDKTPKFHKLNPDLIIATNIDFDHPDVYRNIEETKAAFLKFFDDKKLLLCGDDNNLMSLIGRLKKSRYKTYGFSATSDYRIVNPRVVGEYSEFEMKGIGRFKINLFGKSNIGNAAAAIVMLTRLGFKAKAIADALPGFYGAERRFERIYFKNNIYLYDDYAHHPTEIISTIEAARDRFKNRKIIVIFQPHTYSRTAFLLKEFTESLIRADLSLILPIFASARESKYEFEITSSDIVKGTKADNLLQFKNSVDLIDKLKTVLQKGDVIFTMGAGDVYKLKADIIKIIDSLTG